MITNRELGAEDYLAIARRRLRIVLVPALPLALLAFLASFAVAPRYTSRTLLLVEPQVVPAGYVKPIITQRVSYRMTTLEQNVLSRSRLQPLVDRLGLVRPGHSEDEVIAAIRANLRITEADPNASLGFNMNPRTGIDDVAGFYVNFSADNARDAQQICAEIASLLLEENLEVRQQAAQSTTDFIARQLEQAKQNLDAQDQKISEFKKLHMGQLPSDEDMNLKILSGLTSQLDANTQAVTRAQQDKAFAESVLSQQLSAWNSYRAAPNLPNLRDKLAALQNRLIELQSRYTEDHPDVQKTERDVAEIRARLKAANADPDAENPAEEMKAKVEPPEILRLRLQIHQDDGAIERANHNQDRLQRLISSYQSRLSLSPDIEEQYMQLTRDSKTAHEIYDGLLTNKSSAEMQTEMERKQQGEQVKLLDPASFPTAPSSPIRWKFAAAGFGMGLGIGVCIAFWQEMQDKSIRNEGDVVAALELPMLAALPWLGDGYDGKGNQEGRVRQFPERGSRTKFGA